MSDDRERESEALIVSAVLGRLEWCCRHPGVSFDVVLRGREPLRGVTLKAKFVESFGFLYEEPVSIDPYVPFSDGSVIKLSEIQAIDCEEEAAARAAELRRTLD
jgi:hypothetical protein